MSTFITAKLPTGINPKKFVGVPLVDCTDSSDKDNPNIIGKVTEVIGEHYNGVIYDDDIAERLIKDNKANFSIEVQKGDLIL